MSTPPMNLMTTASPPPDTTMSTSSPSYQLEALRPPGSYYILDQIRSYLTVDMLEKEKIYSVIGFVTMLEIAHQFFEFKRYLPTVWDKWKPLDSVSCPSVMAYAINDDNEKTRRFNLLADSTIGHCVMVYHREMYAKKQECKKVEAKDVDPFTIRNPACYLLYRAREEGYELDHDPEVELQKIKDLAPLFYYEHLFQRPETEEPVTVKVSNIPFIIEDQEIRVFFRQCGYITSFETERAADFRTARITFNSMHGAEKALEFSGQVVRMLEMKSSSNPLLVEVEKDQDAGGTKSGFDLKSTLEQALEKYKDIRSRYCTQNMKFKAVDEELRHRNNGWMVVESTANGCHTTTGKCLLPPNRPS